MAMHKKTQKKKTNQTKREERERERALEEKTYIFSKRSKEAPMLSHSLSLVSHLQAMVAGSVCRCERKIKSCLDLGIRDKNARCYSWSGDRESVRRDKW